MEVSVICITYNHEKYIKDTLEGFIKQKTNFKYEVIVHDDASTDGTADIIREYEKKYPDIIKPIYQTENQHSKGRRIIDECVYPNTTGKYVAFCEGDDYWSDENKLQMQYDIMEKNPQCPICTHRTRCIDMRTGKMNRYIPTTDQVLSAGVLDYKTQLQVSLTSVFHLSSCFIRRAEYAAYLKSECEFKKYMPVGDKKILLYFAKLGNMYYIDKTMSTYRNGVEGSWTLRIARNKDAMLQHRKKMIVALDLCREFYDNKELDELFYAEILKLKLELIKSMKKLNYLFAEDSVELHKKCKKVTVIKTYVYVFLPILSKIKKYIKYRILGRH